MKRNIFTVARAIQDATPKDHKFHGFIGKFIEGLAYKAPEQLECECWRSLSHLMNANLTWPPVEDWGWEVASIITTKSVDELKAEVAAEVSA